MHKSVKVFSLGLLLLGVVSSSAGAASIEYNLAVKNDSSAQNYTLMVNSKQAYMLNNQGTIYIHPGDTGEYNITEGDTVQVKTDPLVNSSCTIGIGQTQLTYDANGSIINMSCSESGSTCSCTES